MGFECLEKCLRTSFRGYGRLVARHPKIFLLTPLLATGLLSFGFAAFRIETDIAALFTVPGALSRREITVMRQFSRTGSGVAAGSTTATAAESSFSKTTSNNRSQSDESSGNSGDSEFRWFDLFSLDKNGRNIFTSDVVLEISEHLSFVYDNLTCYSERKNDGSIDVYKYSNFCHSENGCLRMDKTYETLAKFLTPRYASSSAISLTYPSMSVYGRSSVWAELLRGVTLDKNNVVKEVRVFIAPLQFQYDRSRVAKKILDRCMHKMADYFWNSESRNNLTFYASYEQLFIDELQKTQQYSLPWLSLSVFLVAAFCTLSTVEGCQLWGERRRRGGQQHSQISEAGYGLLTIGMSLIAGFGLLFICNQSYNFVVSCTPFVALCVSVDNDFMLLAAWRRTSHRQSVAGRLSEAFADAGPSLTITSLTDILCFAIGSVSAVAAVSTFCLFTAVTLTFRYIFQMTFFAAVICYSNLEEKDARKQSPFYKIFFCTCFSNVENDKLKNAGSTAPETDSEHFMHRFFRIYWTKFLVCRLTRILLMLLYAIYVIFSLILTSKLVINITPVRVLAEDSKLVPVFNSGEMYSGTSTIIGHAFVLKPPDLRYKINRTLINSLVEELKRTKYYSNETSTIQMWFFDYVNYYNYMTGSDSVESQDGGRISDEDLISADQNFTSNSSDSIAFDSKSGFEEEFYSYLPDFFNAEMYKKYASDIHWKAAKDPLEPNIESFVFKLYHRNVITWDDHVHLMLHWRQACAKFPRLDAMVVDRNSLNPYMDERLSVAPTTLQTMGIALLSMMVATGLMMPDVTGMFYITLSFLSVDVGVVGFLNLWRCDLDLTTMTGILMTIGFSVYYTARVCYGYQTTFSVRESKNQSRHPTRKLSETLGAVGWPVLQGGVGTVLGIAPLAVVPCYVTRTFFKTIVLVVSAGLFHGLMIMPIMMTCLDTNVTKNDRKKRRQMWKNAMQARLKD